MTHDAPFGSLSEHWHPQDTPDYLSAAIDRVRASCGLAAAPETPNMATATREHPQTSHLNRISLPGDEPMTPHMMPETLTATEPRTAASDAPEACRDRAALLARFWTRRQSPLSRQYRAVRARQREAVTLRRQGVTYGEIARHLGYYDATSAMRAIQRYESRESARAA